MDHFNDIKISNLINIFNYEEEIIFKCGLIPKLYHLDDSFIRKLNYFSNIKILDIENVFLSNKK